MSTRKAHPPARWSEREYPAVLFITYALDDPDDAPVLDVSHSLRETRHCMEGRSGYVYRIERLPKAGWSDPNKPEYGLEQFVEAIGEA